MLLVVLDDQFDLLAGDPHLALISFGGDSWAGRET